MIKEAIVNLFTADRTINRCGFYFIPNLFPKIIKKITIKLMVYGNMYIVLLDIDVVILYIIN